MVQKTSLLTGEQLNFAGAKRVILVFESYQLKFSLNLKSALFAIINCYSMKLMVNETD